MLVMVNKGYYLEIKEIEKSFYLNKSFYKVINVDPKKKPEESLIRTEIEC